MVQAICALADTLAANRVQGFHGWLFVWCCYTAFCYLGFSTLLIPWFAHFYVYPTYDKWRRKSNPKYPSPKSVIGEIFMGVVLANPSVTFAPSIHLALISNGTLRHHCDTPLTWQYRVYSFVMVLFIVDLYSWTWHFLGHYVGSLWSVHKHHHRFANPTPFSTIADLPPDNIVRSLYMIVVNVISYGIVGLPVDVDVLYFVTAIIIGVYGMYFHCGHEFESLPYNHPILNTSYQHYVHHALSYRNKPYYTGFVFKIWDDIAGAHYHGKEVIPALEDQKLGNRSFERWEKEVMPLLPDYGVLLSPSFWCRHWRDAVAPAIGRVGGVHKQVEETNGKDQ